MKIQKICDDELIFDNGNRIYTEHFQDCCEWNYADFTQLDSIAYDYDFDENLKFEKLETGFRFGDNGYMFYVPCFSEQNGYYSIDVDVYYFHNNKYECVISGQCCEWIDK